MSQMKKTRRPVVLTVNGKAELVVQGAKSYQQILDQLDRLEAVEAIRLGIAAAEETSQNPRWPMPRTTFIRSKTYWNAAL
jgi:PHD/YefM family antitoxin component YafN of YafNO toxin-antitoxin module